MSGARLTNSSVDLVKKMLTVALATLSLAACQKAPEEEPKMLAITGYNYTDRYIDGFSVNGQGGSNVLLSDDADGGGKTACCIVWRPGTALPVTMFVEWTYGIEGNLQTGEVYREPETLRAEVELTGPVPEHPTVFVVHFYPNNTVQLEVAEDYPKPRLKRSELEQGAKP
ncbi:MAG: DUF3304 domain-containing protein [Gammaproteobacteria bacterium]|nr:DUF3304 domain-containing protein [Gammaproteobacteria bacterium]